MDGLFTEQVERELAKARERYQPIHSLHEGYAVILEELDELWSLCREWKGDTDELAPLVWKECIQIAAMAQRLAEDILR